MRAVFIYRYILSLLIFFGFVSCYCHDDSPDKVAENKILLLKFNTVTLELEAGKEYKYFNKYSTFTLLPDTVKGITDTLLLRYKENNAILFKATLSCSTEKAGIQLPEDFLPASHFTITHGHFFEWPPEYEKIGSVLLSPEDYTELCEHIKNLHIVQKYIQANPLQKIKLMKYQSCTGTSNPAQDAWIMLITN